MMRNIIRNFRAVGFRTPLELHRVQIISPSATSSNWQHPFPAFSTKSSSPPDSAQAINNWESSLSEETRNRLFEIKVEVGNQTWMNFYEPLAISQYFFQLRMHFEAGHRVCNPDDLTVKQWQYILSLKTDSARRAEYSYIGRKQHYRVRGKVRDSFCCEI